MLFLRYNYSKLRYLCCVSASKLQMNAAQMSSMKLKRNARVYDSVSVCVYGQCSWLLLVCWYTNCKQQMAAPSTSVVRLKCMCPCVCIRVYVSVCMYASVPEHVCGFVWQNVSIRYCWICRLAIHEMDIRVTRQGYTFYWCHIWKTVHAIDSRHLSGNILSAVLLLLLLSLLLLLGVDKISVSTRKPLANHH